MNNNLLSKITIIIVTFERVKNLNLLLKFLDNSNNKIKILVLDSSKKNNLKNLYRSQKNFIKYKKFNHSTFLAKKINKGLKYVKTKYSLICADDDFLIVDSLLPCLKFFEKNKDYSSVQGNHYDFDNKYLSNFKKIFFGKLQYSSYSNENRSPLIRLFNYLSNKNPVYTFYSLHKTNDLKKIWYLTSKYINDYSFIEYCSTSLSLLIGKAKVLNNVYLIRSQNLNVSNKLKNKKKITLINLKKFIKCINYFFITCKLKSTNNLNEKLKSSIINNRLKNKQKFNVLDRSKIFIKKILPVDYFLLKLKLKNTQQIKIHNKKNISILKKIIIENNIIRQEEIEGSRKLNYY